MDEQPPTADQLTRPTAHRPSGGAQAGDVLLGRFRLERIIGEGGMGRVYAARDLQMDGEPQIAVKILSEALQSNPMADSALQRECRKVRMLAHDAIVRVFEFYRAEGQAFITMELLEGESLDVMVKRHPQGMDITEALPIIQAAGKALAYAHEQHPPFVHSDFKPSNVFLTRAGKIKVLDFGVARAVRSSELTTSGLSVFDPAKFGALTPAYASCEMLAGLPADPRDDVYALACVAYELLSGQHPYARRPADQARSMKLPLTPIAAVSSQVHAALARGMTFDREARTASADQFVAELIAAAQAPAHRTAPFLKAAVVVVPVALAAITAYALWHKAPSSATKVASTVSAPAPVPVAASPPAPVSVAPTTPEHRDSEKPAVAAPPPVHTKPPRPKTASSTMPASAKPSPGSATPPQSQPVDGLASPNSMPSPSAGSVAPITAQGYPVEGAQVGSIYRGSFQTYGYEVPLPPGEWTLLSGAQTMPNLRPGNTGHDYELARIESNRLVEGMRIQALRSAPSPGVGFARNIFCQDPGNLYVQVEALTADAHQSCWRIYDVFTGGWLDLASDQDAVHAAGVRKLVDMGASFPQDLVTVAFFRAETWGALLVQYSFNPEHEGISSHPATNPRESDWYVGNVNRYPEKSRYLAKLKDWANASWPKFQQAFDRAQPR